jgi:hypothetical protein
MQQQQMMMNSGMNNLPYPQAQMLQQFWATQVGLVDQAALDEMKVHQLPLARIKKVMKADEEVRHRMVRYHQVRLLWFHIR